MACELYNQFITRDSSLNINAPAIIKVQDVIFLCEQNTLSAISRDFHGDQKSRDLHEKSQEMADKVFFPNKKNNVTNVIIAGALVVLCPCGLHTYIKNT